MSLYVEKYGRLAQMEAWAYSSVLDSQAHVPGRHDML